MTHTVGKNEQEDDAHGWKKMNRKMTHTVGKNEQEDDVHCWKI